MDTLFLYNTKTLKEKFNTKVFAGDNLITKINVQIPDNIGGYPKADCEYNLRAIIPEGNLSYMIDPAQPYFYITNDITETAQTVKLMMIITHEGNVIGRTNTVDLIVNEPAEAPDPPLTPREEFDEVIAEQRAEIAEQAETIETQDKTISQQTEQITELNGEVSELTTENTRLENLTETQRETIQYMVDNPPALEYPENSIIPTRQSQTIRPTPPFYGIGRLDIAGYTPNNQNKTVTPTTSEQTITAGESYDGLGAVTVEPTPLEDKTVTPTNAETTYTPTAPNIGFSSVTVKATDIPEGGIFITQANENGYPIKYLIKNFGQVPANGFSLKFYDGTVATYLEEIVFENCPNITIFIDGTFRGLNSLKKVVLPSNLTSLSDTSFYSDQNLESVDLGSSLTTIGRQCFENCVKLAELDIPDSVSSIGSYAFNHCEALTSFNIPTSLTTISLAMLSSCTGLTSLIIPNNIEIIGISAIMRCTNLKTVSIPNSLTSIEDTTTFHECNNLEFITIENGFNCNNLNLSVSILYSQETIVSWLEALADRTGQTAYTLTIGTTNINKLTAEQRAIATNKNWNLA